MQRKPQQLEEEVFDVVIVGGGIYGAALAREAALRGLSAALIEKNDFCSATSANSLKIIHGGLRYLQQADIIRIRESVRERRAMLRIAPHLIRPLPCLMPTTGLLKSRPAMFAALIINDLLSADRNRGLPPEKRLGRGRVISRGQLDELLPGQRLQGTGAAVWYDAIADDTERVVVEMVQSAVINGAAAANYIEMTGFLRNGKNISGVTALDRLSGRRLEIRGQLVINAAGPWVNGVLSTLDGEVAPLNYTLALAMNAVLRRELLPTYAVGAPCQEPGPDYDRLMFFAPWQGVTMGGTFYRHWNEGLDELSPGEADIERLLSQLNSALPAAGITRDDITRIHAGLLPCKPPRHQEDDPDLLLHYRLVDHRRRDGVDGLISVLSVKYTTARDVAQRTVDLAARKLGKAVRKSPTAELPLPGASEWSEDGDSPPLADLARQAAANEMAQTLADIVCRRGCGGGRALPPEDMLRECAAAAGEVLGWDAKRIADEISKLKAEYPAGATTLP